MKTRLLGLLSAAALIGGCGIAFADEPLTLTDAQMDQVAAGQTTLFVGFADEASIAAQDDPVFSTVAAATNDAGATQAIASSLFNDGAAGVGLNNAFNVLLTLN